MNRRDVIKLYKHVRKKLGDSGVDGEVVVVHLDFNHRDSLLYLPIILAVIGSGNAFYFVGDKNKLHQEAEVVGSRVVVSSKSLKDWNHVDNICVTVLSSSTSSPTSSLPADTVYVIRTSGSTGRPRTVYVTNSSIVPNIVDISGEWSLGCDDVVLLSSPSTFDPHIIDVFVSSISAANLLFIPRNILVSHVDIDSVTVLHCTPSLLRR